MQTINGLISLLFNQDGLHLEIYDDDAVVKFVEIHLSAEQTMQAMSRLARVPCKKCEVKDLDKVGFVKESKNFIFEISDGIIGRVENAKKIVQEVCPKGWTPDLYFGSQDSFFSKDGKYFAKTSIMRWKKGEIENE